ncbi:hypothetical protein BKA62DRAFT_283184 [Auriculariales sp. MPI-PUGE-AT-0066]|nr:hypothetical protein BKA62DRAFT_283184 [Auriculariales sp. MPI-PUGE-AT-0066]
MTTIDLDQKVAIFAAQHVALTRELDELEQSTSERPRLETAHDFLRRSVTAAEKRILQGREQLKSDWRAHSASSKGKAPNRLDHEAKAYQDALARWDAEEEGLRQSKTQKLDAMRKLYECRERQDRHLRMLAHLDGLYSVVFDGVKIEDPEWSFFEWQTQCAKIDLNLVCSRLETSVATLKVVTALYSTLTQINRHYTTVEETAMRYPQCWKDIQKWSDTKDYMVSITGALGFVETYLRKTALDHLGKLKEHCISTNALLEAPDLLFFPCQQRGNLATMVDGMQTSLFVPHKYLHPEDSAPTDFVTASTAIRDALQVLEIERDTVQQRIDMLTVEATQARSILETEHERRRSYRKACFENIAARGTGRTRSHTTVSDPPHLAPPLPSPTALGTSVADPEHEVLNIASVDHPPAYSHRAY